MKSQKIYLPTNQELNYDKDFFQDYGIFVKPIDYPMSSRKVESLVQIAHLQKYLQCNPVKAIDLFFNIELLDVQALMVERSWIVPKVLIVASRGLGKTTTIDLELMAKDMLFCNYWTYIASGSGAQAEQTFGVLEKLANNGIDSFQGSTGEIFKNEVVVHNNNGDGFSHERGGFAFEVYNGSMTKTLNSNIDRKRGISLCNI